MDTLVAQYTSSPFDKEAFSEVDQQDYTQSIPSLSLRFALPPVPRVCRTISKAHPDLGC
jgi:20S proteasome subunit beta 5